MTGQGARAVGGLLALAALVLVVGVAWIASPSAAGAGGATTGPRTPGSAAGAGAPGAGAGAAAAPAGVVEAGRGLFVANCAACHGPQGQGGPAGPTLVGVGAASADFYLRTGRMPLSAPGQRVVRQRPVFDDAQTQALVAYVASLGPGPGVPQVSAGGDLRRGFALFQANCAACHAATGTGNAIGGGFVAVGLGNADPRTIGEATIIGPGAMPAFSFDDAQLADISAYVKFLQAAPNPGGAAVAGTGPVAEGFVAVAVALPLLLLVSLFVARHGRQTAASGAAPPAPPPPATERTVA